MSLGVSGVLQAALFDHYDGKLVMTSKTIITNLARVSVSCRKEVRLKGLEPEGSRRGHKRQSVARASGHCSA